MFRLKNASLLRNFATDERRKIFFRNDVGKSLLNRISLVSRLSSLVLIVALALLAPAAFAQQAPADIDAVKKRAELNSAKADLEEARKKRDMAVAARWKDRETANQERELFNEKYNESKEKVDALMSERARLFEDVRVAREDLAQVKLQAEKARAEFLSLAAGPERLEALAKFQEQGIPFKISERVEVQNKVKKEMGLYKDDPVRIARGLFDAARAEMDFTREIQMERGELVFGRSVAQGMRPRACASAWAASTPWNLRTPPTASPESSLRP